MTACLKKQTNNNNLSALPRSVFRLFFFLTGSKEWSTDKQQAATFPPVAQLLSAELFPFDRYYIIRHASTNSRRLPCRSAPQRELFPFDRYYHPRFAHTPFCFVLFFLSRKRKIIVKTIRKGRMYYFLFKTRARFLY